MIIREILSGILLISGFIFMTISAVGVVRLPDFFSRLHASSIGETLGIVLAGIGLAIYGGLNLTSAKILLVVAALFLVNPLGTHLISKAAIRSGEQPWREDSHADISH
ncbi:monovalent cation/H(+) antiporter subunit G [Ihubacter sp. mB4P-1]|uniref:monovalent cation/H(+) antiporter subunit G n=1 Tax=Ihubacter sp. mB4P-1 TaxID=3242370 RepID=UPI001379E172